MLSGISASAQSSLDNQGTEFYLGFMPNFHATAVVEVHLTADTATTVTIEYPVGTVLSTESITPGGVTIASVPISAASGWTADSVQSNLVRASAADEFVAYMIDRRTESSDAALALPVDTFNTEYIVMDYNPRFVGSEFLVTAAFDDTTVTIIPTTALVGHAAGVPFDVELDRGEGYFARSATTVATNTLTGTTACDHIFEVAQPVQTWRTEIGVANLPQRSSGSIYRIVASEDGTAVTQDGAALATLDRGQFFETAALAGNHVFRGDAPIHVSVDNYTFSTVGGGQFADHFVTIVAANGDVGTLELDGVAVPAADFSPGHRWSGQHHLGTGVDHRFGGQRAPDRDHHRPSGHRQTVKVAMSLPDGSYDISLVSSDPDHLPGVEVDQDKEQWYLEIFRVKPGKSDKRVYRSPAIDDLAEADTILSQVVATGVELDSGGSYKLRARHAAKSGVNSIIPLCAKLDPSP